MLTDSALYVLQQANKLARSKNHDFLLISHLLRCLLDNEQIIDVFAKAKVDIKGLSNELDNVIDKCDIRSANHEDMARHITPETVRIMNRATDNANRHRRDKGNCYDLLYAMLTSREEESDARYYLHKYGFEIHHINEYFGSGEATDIPSDGPEANINEKIKSHRLESEPVGSSGNSKQANEVIRDLLTNLNDMAKNGYIDDVIGREPQIEEVIQSLSRRTKNNPILIGEPGVGKTAIAEGLAKAIHDGICPEVLKNCTVYSLNVGDLVAGTRFRGEFEERLKIIINYFTKEKENSILFIDEIHTLIGSGATGGGSLDGANILKPALARGTIRCIGATTHEEFRQHFEKDAALARRFQRIDIPEPNRNEAIQILLGVKKKYEDHHKVTYSDEAMIAAVDLSSRYIQDRHLPDKAFDVIDTAGANLIVLPEDQRPEVIDKKFIESIVSRMVGLPEQSINQGDRELLRNLESNIKNVIFDQDNAVEAVTRVIKRNRAGLSDPNRPMGVFFFTGPTGVGKTELANQLSRELNMPLHRFDMSEYSSQTSVSKMIGSDPGYVGYEKGGQLTEKIRRQPYSILLLDEIEKAHSDVYDALLQAFDNGFMTDNAGGKVNFRNAIIIMTSNAGAQQASQRSIGFRQSGESQYAGNEAAIKAIKGHFAPEFLARCVLVGFNRLSDEGAMRVANKFLQEITDRAESRNVAIQISPKAREAFVAKAEVHKNGARDLRDLIETEISDTLAEEILFGDLTNGGKTTVTFKDEKFVFKNKKLQNEEILQET